MGIICGLLASVVRDADEGRSYHFDCGFKALQLCDEVGDPEVSRIL